MIILYGAVCALFICELLETDWAAKAPHDRVIDLALIATGIFACGWGIAFDLLT